MQCILKTLDTEHQIHSIADSPAEYLTRQDMRNHLSIIGELLRGKIGIRLAKGLSWSFFSGLLASSFSLLSSILVARWLGPEKYGAFGIVQSTLNTISVFIIPAVGMTATKYIAELRDRNPERAGRILGMTLGVTYCASFLVSLALCMAANFLATTVCRASGLAPLFRISSLALFFLIINGAQLGCLAGIEFFHSIAMINIVRGLITLPLMYLWVQMYGLDGAIWALAITAVVTFGASEILMHKSISKIGLPITFRNITADFRLLLTFSLPAILTSTIVLGAMWLGNIVIVRTNNGYAEFGIFNAANQWRTAILFLPSVIARPFLPILANLIGDNESRSFRITAFFSVVATATAAIGVSSLLYLFGQQIASLYGAEYSSARTAINWIILATLFAAPTIAIIQVINACGKMWGSAIIHLLWASVFLVALRFTPMPNAEKLAMIYAIAYLIQLVLFIIYVYRITKNCSALTCFRDASVTMYAHKEIETV
jgi:O-antigen/teichoic acid export membrane protein